VKIGNLLFLSGMLPVVGHEPQYVGRVGAALSAEEIAEYVATGEPMDKAGAYAIQGRASKFVERIDGCFFNVVGLPLALVYRKLKKIGQTQRGSQSSILFPSGS